MHPSVRPSTRILVVVLTLPSAISRGQAGANDEILHHQASQQHRA